MKGLNSKMNAPALAARTIRVRAVQTYGVNFNTARYVQLLRREESRAASPMRARRMPCMS